MKNNLAAIPSDQIIHVKFSDFIQDNVEVVKRIFASKKLKLDASILQNIHMYLSQNPRDGAKKFQYSLEEFNITEGDVQRIFQSYVDMNMYNKIKLNPEQ